MFLLLIIRPLTQTIITLWFIFVCIDCIDLFVLMSKEWLSTPLLEVEPQSSSQLKSSLLLWCNYPSWENTPIKIKKFQNGDGTVILQISRLKACAFTAPCSYNPGRKSNSTPQTPIPFKSYYNLETKQPALQWMEPMSVCQTTKKKTLNLRARVFSSIAVFITRAMRGAKGGLPGSLQRRRHSFQTTKLWWHDAHPVKLQDVLLI